MLMIREEGFKFDVQERTIGPKHTFLEVDGKRVGEVIRPTTRLRYEPGSGLVFSSGNAPFDIVVKLGGREEPMTFSGNAAEIEKAILAEVDGS